jgi:5-hydroxyisourate hydrolase
MSPITTHVLDTMLGTPASGMAVALEIATGQDHFREVARSVTDANGRISEFDPPLKRLEKQTYRLRFATGPYFATTCVHTFYPEVVVVVAIDETSRHYHIPLLLSPFGYSTYRGS